MNPDSTESLLQKLCDLQQQQLDKLTEVSRHLAETAVATRSSYEGYQRNLDESSKRAAEMAAESRKSYEAYERHLDAYEKTLKDYQADEPELTRSAIVIASMLGVLAVAIIVSRFL